MEKSLDIQKQQFMSILNHDLKTPVLAQIRSLELLLSGVMGELNPRQTEIVRLNKESCETILDMVSTVLVNYKFENNNVVLNSELINLKEIVEECCHELRQAFVEKLLRVELEIENEIWISGDKAYLKQAFLNIISNSITYAYKDSLFKIVVNNTGMNACISVINKGNPLTDETIESMFDYYACNVSKHTKIGFGIKLYLALQIIKAHLGGIVVKNGLCNEVKFEIILPNCRKVSSIVNFEQNIILNRNISA